MARTKRNNQKSDIPVAVDLKSGQTVYIDNNLEKKPICQHINKSLDINSVKKSVIKEGGFLQLTCLTCSKNRKTDLNFDNLCLCLKCGCCCCLEHIADHINTPRSDPHHLSLQLTAAWAVRCYKCNTDIELQTSRKLENSLDILKQIYDKSFSTNSTLKKTIILGEEVVINNLTAKMDSGFSFECNESVDEISASPMKMSVSLFRARGLSNLGNTCFFNSVLQCLAHTPFLLETLHQSSKPGQKVSLKIQDEEIIAELDKWGPLTESLAETLDQITRVKEGCAYSPGILLNNLRQKCRQFMGFNQHDSQELLRQLLDSVKTEDLRRYQIHILHHFGLTKKVNPDEVDEKKRQMAKKLNQKLAEIVVICPDQVFKGTLVSTVQCIKCQHTSEVIENFLDLSLPVSFDRSESSLSLTVKPEKKSKHQLKKERRMARKSKSGGKSGHQLKNGSVFSNEARKGTMDVSEEKPLSPQLNKDVTKSTGSGSEKMFEPVPVPPPLPPPPPDSQQLFSLFDQIRRPRHSSTSIEVKENGIADLSNDEEKGTKDASDFEHSALKTNHRNETSEPRTMVNNIESSSDVVNDIDMENSSPENHRYRRLVNSPSSSPVAANLQWACSSDNSSCSSVDDNDEEKESDDEEDEEEESADDYLSVAVGGSGFKCVTLQPPLNFTDGDSSIESCLTQFTAREILMGNNSVCCDACTERRNKELPASNEKKKPVLQPSTKQLLIRSPPAVLILHLKRFQGSMFASFRKVTKMVKYPLILDIGPFCSAKCADLLMPNQQKVLYSLYGIVEHSGGMYGGHYVSYVKSREPVSKDSYRRSFLSGTASPISEIRPEYVEEELQKPGQWYYISDSSVRTVTEQEVLKAQAYLLFYERIV